MNLSMSGVSAGHLLTDKTLKSLQPPDSDKYHTHLLWKAGHQIFLNDILCISWTDQSDCQVHIRSPSLFRNALMYVQKD
jgi:hypothetical protein